MHKWSEYINELSVRWLLCSKSLLELGSYQKCTQHMGYGGKFRLCCLGINSCKITSIIADLHVAYIMQILLLKQDLTILSLNNLRFFCLILSCFFLLNSLQGTSIFILWTFKKWCDLLYRQWFALSLWVLCAHRCSSNQVTIEILNLQMR